MRIEASEFGEVNKMDYWNFRIYKNICEIEEEWTNNIRLGGMSTSLISLDYDYVEYNSKIFVFEIDLESIKWKGIDVRNTFDELSWFAFGDVLPI